MAGNDGDIDADGDADADSDARAELEARIYSRSGADEPRIARFDDETGRVLELTTSEWRLLEFERGRPAPVTDGADDQASGSADASEQRPAATTTPRRRMSPLAAGAIGFAVGVGLLAAWFGISAAVERRGGFEVTITPTPAADADATLPAAAALDYFRDPRRGDGSLPGWLNATFERSGVARVIGPDGPAPGATVYAAISHDEIACLIVILESNGIEWNCSSVERVLHRGMTMHALIPRDLGGHTDPDGDGVMGTASDANVLTVEWNADGSFTITRHEP
ncbi:hypothetical protein [Agromyces sp. Soil535]|uniref:hypothetical protein n=1 Tax=Agromyces sp. Soil535 TaxID=1736390 RepID=UPI0007011747|nr:hypothetical protein [Agromyces sp. Soil535]KRE26230.1 hypothetical protein ASG80_05435 [Agromyces sp. Soil535]